LIAHIVCRLAGHRRSIASARRIGGVWRSRCKRCGAEIVRVSPSKWRHRATVDLLALRQELLRHLDQRYAVADRHGADLHGAFLEHEIEPMAEREIEYHS
jgi:hypothetical protein